MSKSGSDLFKHTAGANAALVQELVESGANCTPENIVFITKDPAGKICWLETGNEKAGLRHVLSHQKGFTNQGVSVEEIPNCIMEAIHQGKVIGFQDRKQTRAIYEFVYEGIVHHVAITIGSNGFIVGANPK